MSIGIREALAPVMDWYQSDEVPGRNTVDIVRDVVADLQEDRRASLVLQKIVLAARKYEGDEAHRIMPHLWPLIAEADKLPSMPPRIDPRRAGMISKDPPDAYPMNGMIEMLSADNARMRTAGGELAEAASRVVHTHDGCHRLSLAIAKWYQAIASEGGRPHGEPEEKPDAV